MSLIQILDSILRALTGKPSEYQKLSKENTDLKAEIIEATGKAEQIRALVEEL